MNNLPDWILNANYPRDNAPPGTLWLKFNPYIFDDDRLIRLAKAAQAGHLTALRSLIVSRSFARAIDYLRNKVASFLKAFDNDESSSVMHAWWIRKRSWPSGQIESLGSKVDQWDCEMSKQ